MSTSLSRSLPWLTSAALAVYGAVQAIDARNARRAARAEVLRADSLAAVQDSLRVVLADHAGRVWWWQQRAVQVELERDQLARELDQERKATARLRLELDTLRVRSAAPVAVVDTLRDIRRATFAERLRYGAQEFGALFAHVVMPAPPAQATLEAEVALDSVVIVPEVRCGAPGPAGIAPALVTLRTPVWIQARADSAVVDPDVCNPLPRETPRPQMLGLPLPKVEELIAALAGAVAWEIVR